MTDELLYERVFKKVKDKLEQQKNKGKVFISDEEVDLLIDKIINDEIR